MAKLSLVFDKETCGRCGGTGRYSFNLRDGDRCFKCGGSKLVLSRAGKKAHAAWSAFKEERCTKAFGEVVAGEVVMYSRFVPTMSGGASYPARPVRVLEVIEDTLNHDADGRSHVTLRLDVPKAPATFYGASRAYRIGVPVSEAVMREWFAAWGGKVGVSLVETP